MLNMFKHTVSRVFKSVTQLGGKPMQHKLLLLAVLFITSSALQASEGSLRITGKVWETTKVSQEGSKLNITSSTATKSPQKMTVSSQTDSSTFILDTTKTALDFEQFTNNESEFLTLSITTL